MGIQYKKNMDYKESKHLKLFSKSVFFRYAGWQGCFNVLPYIVIRKNPIRTDWKDFSIELGWLLWAFGVRIQPVKVCGNCDAYCECHLFGAKSDDVSCEYFYDTTLS